MMKNVNFIIKHNSLTKGFMKKLLAVSLCAFFIAFTKELFALEKANKFGLLLTNS